MSDQRVTRLRSLLALEIARIVDDLEMRRDFLLRTWGKHRDRAPFIDTVFNRWKTVGFPDLALLSAQEVAAVDGFFSKVEEFRLYVSYTQDMPTTMADRYDFMAERLRAWGEVALDSLGGAPARPEVVDAEMREGFLMAFATGDESDNPEPNGEGTGQNGGSQSQEE